MRSASGTNRRRAQANDAKNHNNRRLSPLARVRDRATDWTHRRGGDRARWPDGRRNPRRGGERHDAEAQDNSHRCQRSLFACAVASRVLPGDVRSIQRRKTHVDCHGPARPSNGAQSRTGYRLRCHRRARRRRQTRFPPRPSIDCQRDPWRGGGFGAARARLSRPRAARARRAGDPGPGARTFRRWQRAGQRLPLRWRRRVPADVRHAVGGTVEPRHRPAHVRAGRCQGGGVQS